MNNDIQLNIPKEFNDDIPNNQSTSPTSLVIPKEFSEPEKPLSIGDKFSNAVETMRSTANAATLGVEQGVKDFASTVAKVGAKVLPYSWTGLTPEDVQGVYNKQLEDYNKDADTNAHPWASGIGRVSGQVASTAPLGALGAVGATASGAGKVIGAIAGNAALGAAQGALTNSPDQGSDIINKEGAAIGGILGGSLGAIGQAAGSYAKGVTKYGNYSDSLKKAGYSGPVFSTDVPESQGIWNSIKETIANRGLSKIPLVSKIPYVGVNAARDAQETGINRAIINMADNITDLNPGATAKQFENILRNAKNLKNNTIAGTANDFRNTLQANNITSHKLVESDNIINSLLGENSKQLSDDVQNAFISLKDNNISTDKLLGTKNGAGLKQLVWSEAERLGQDRTKTASYNASNKLYSLYNALNRDIERSIENVPDAIQAFHKFNTTTRSLNTLWDPDNSKLLATAMKDIDGDKRGLQTFLAALQSPKTSADTIQKYEKILGSDATDLVQRANTGRILARNINPETGNVNISRLMKDIGSAQPGTLNVDTSDALNGLMQLAQKITKGQEGAKVSPGLDAALNVGAGAGVATSVPFVKELMVAGGALGSMIAHAPLKNTLIGLSKLTGLSPNKGLGQYLTHKAMRYMTRAGVAIQTSNENNIEITGGNK